MKRSVHNKGNLSVTTYEDKLANERSSITPDKTMHRYSSFLCFAEFLLLKLQLSSLFPNLLVLPFHSPSASSLHLSLHFYTLFPAFLHTFPSLPSSVSCFEFFWCINPSGVPHQSLFKRHSPNPLVWRPAEKWL